jgi:hypothetical protein
MKDPKGHGSNGKGVAKDPGARQRQLAHIRAHYAAKALAAPEGSGEQHVLALADQHGVPTAHLGYDPQALADFGKWEGFYNFVGRETSWQEDHSTGTSSHNLMSRRIGD